MKLKIPIFACGLIAALTLAQPALAQNTPLTLDQAHKGIVKIYTYETDVNFFLSVKSSGSGIIINDKGLILTNYHVIADTKSNEMPTETAYKICLTQRVEVTPACEHVAKIVATDKKNDVALLKIAEQPLLPSQSSFPFIELESGSAVSVGESVTALGYPGIGGKTITVSQGKISGKETIGTQAWLKTDAVFSFGSSGGALLNDLGKIVGITTATNSDGSTLGYVIDAAPLKNWLAQHSGKTPANNTYLNLLTRMILDEKKLKTSYTNLITLRGVQVYVKKPAGWETTIDGEATYSFDDEEDPDGGYLSITFLPVPFRLTAMSLPSYLKIDAPFFEVKKIKKVNFKKTPGYLFEIYDKDQSFARYYAIIQNYVIRISYDAGKDNKDESQIEYLLNSIEIEDAKPVSPQRLYEDSLFSIDSRADLKWGFVPLYNDETPVQLYNVKHPYAAVKADVIDLKKWSEGQETTNNAQLHKKLMQLMNKANTVAQSQGITSKILSSSANEKIGSYSFMSMRMQEKKNKKISDYVSAYTIRKGDTLLQFELMVFHKDKKVFEAADKALREMLELSLTLK